MSVPNTIAERNGRDFIRALNACIRADALYPDGHPVRNEKLDDLLFIYQAATEQQINFDLFIHDNSFFINDRLLSKESLAFQGMMRDWQRNGVKSISLTGGAARRDLKMLVEYLGESGKEPTGPVSVNTAALISPEKLAPEQDRLRRAYSDALDLIRDLQGSMAKGGAPPLGAAQDAVENLVDAVLSDPGSSVLLTAMRSHDEPTFFHMVNVSILSIATGASMGLNKPQLSVVGVGGLLHDMGKVGVPHEVINRSGPLSDDEWNQIRQHPPDGAALILRSWDKVSPVAAMVAYEHHQRLDGGGYPAKFLNGKTDILSRIVQVADTFDAVTSRRPYRRADQRERALDILLSGAGNHYDPRIVRVFVQMLGFYPPGSVLELDDGSVAVVINNNLSALGRPLVKLVKSAGGDPIEPTDLDLSSIDGSERKIVRGLAPEAAGVDPADFA